MNIEDFKKDYYANMSKNNLICKYEITAYMYDEIMKKVIDIKRPRISKFNTIIIVDKKYHKQSPRSPKRIPKINPPIRNMENIELNPVMRSPRTIPRSPKIIPPINPPIRNMENIELNPPIRSPRKVIGGNDMKTVLLNELKMKMNKADEVLNKPKKKK